LYAGLMLTASGPKVLEFNVRFGDPECQPLMLMLDEDLVPWMLASATGDLPGRPLKWRDGAACCVVMVSGGYPGPIERNMPITGIPSPTDDAVVFFAGAQRRGETVQANGGRVLGVTAFGADLDAACKRAYERVELIHFDTAAWRTDIGR
jgi:phosphoribosylamine--glycine ligase